MGTVMCKQKVVLETIKKTKGRGGMTPAQMQLAESQAEDYQTMKKEIVEIKEDLGKLNDSVELVKNEQNYIRGQVDFLVANSTAKTGMQLILELIRTKSFWTLAIIVSVLYFCGKYNMNPAELVKHLFIGG